MPFQHARSRNSNARTLYGPSRCSRLSAERGAVMTRPPCGLSDTPRPGHFIVLRAAAHIAVRVGKLQVSLFSNRDRQASYRRARHPCPVPRQRHTRRPVEAMQEDGRLQRRRPGLFPTTGGRLFQRPGWLVGTIGIHTREDCAAVFRMSPMYLRTVPSLYPVISASVIASSFADSCCSSPGRWR